MKSIKPVTRILTVVFGMLGVIYLFVAAICLCAHNEGARIVGMVFGTLAAGMIITTIAVIVISRRRTAANELLLAIGRRAEATVTGVVQNPRISLYRTHPWIIYAEVKHPYTYEMVTVHSGYFLQKPTLQPGDPVSVCFDQMNDRRYVIDPKSIL